MSSDNTFDVTNPGGAVGQFPVGAPVISEDYGNVATSPFSSVPMSTSPSGAAPLFNLGGYGTVANSFAVSQGASGGVSVAASLNGQSLNGTVSSQGVTVSQSTTTASNNVLTQGWTSADGPTRILIILGVLGIIASLKGG
jgi:hypothetical protein